MLSYDNTINYAPSFKKIDESIESINTLLTSLLLDTYTNQTFIYSDINVIRINTSQNYDSIQSLSSSLPYKFNASDSTNFFTLSNSGIFASTSTLSDKMNVSDYDLDSSNFFMKSDSGIFASTSTLSDKFNASDSTLFAMESDFEQQISEKLNITDFSLYSLDFASTSDLTSKFDASDSTFFLPSSDYTVPTFTSEYLIDISKFIETHVDYYSHTEMNITHTNIIYNMYPTSFSTPENVSFVVSGQPLLYNLSFTGVFAASNNTIRNFSMESGRMLGYTNEIKYATFNENTYILLKNCSITGTFKKNTFNYNDYNFINGMIMSNNFQNIESMNLSIYSNNGNGDFNTWSNVTKINSYICTSYHNMAKNELYNVKSLVVSNPKSIVYNTFSVGDSYDLYVDDDMYNNSLYGISLLNIKLNTSTNAFFYNTINNATKVNISAYSFGNNSLVSINSLYLNDVIPKGNKFSYCDSVIFNFEKQQTTLYNTNIFSNVKYVEINLGKNITSLNLRTILGLGHSCNIGGININIPPNDYRKSLFEKQIANLTGYPNHLENLMSLSFNSTNDWINSGFENNLSSWAKNNLGIFWNYSGIFKLNVQGSIISSTGKITDLANKYLQPKFSPNYNSLKHYMVLYGDSFRDYFELDPHALEAGHNNNACENILLQKDYTFYSTLPTAAGKDNYTFIQWPSTEITFPKSDYSNNTLLNTITDITNSLSNLAYHTLCYKFGNYISDTYSYAEYTLASSLASQLANTSSSSQLYAGFSYSGLLTSTASTSSYIQY